MLGTGVGAKAGPGARGAKVTVGGGVAEAGSGTTGAAAEVIVEAAGIHASVDDFGLPLHRTPDGEMLQKVLVDVASADVSSVREMDQGGLGVGVEWGCPPVHMCDQLCAALAGAAGDICMQDTMTLGDVVARLGTTGMRFKLEAAWQLRSARSFLVWRKLDVINTEFVEGLRTEATERNALEQARLRAVEVETEYRGARQTMALAKIRWAQVTSRVREMTAAARSLQDTVGVLPAKHRRRLADVEEQLRDEDNKSREAVAGVEKKGRLRDAVAAEVTALERRVQEAHASAARSKNRSAITRTLVAKALHQQQQHLHRQQQYRERRWYQERRQERQQQEEGEGKGEEEEEEEEEAEEGEEARGRELGQRRGQARDDRVGPPSPLAPPPCASCVPSQVDHGAEEQGSGDIARTQSPRDAEATLENRCSALVYANQRLRRDLHVCTKLANSLAIQTKRAWARVHASERNHAAAGGFRCAGNGGAGTGGTGTGGVSGGSANTDAAQLAAEVHLLRTSMEQLQSRAREAATAAKLQAAKELAAVREQAAKELAAVQGQAAKKMTAVREQARSGAHSAWQQVRMATAAYNEQGEELAQALARTRELEQRQPFGFAGSVDGAEYEALRLRFVQSELSLAAERAAWVRRDEQSASHVRELQGAVRQWARAQASTPDGRLENGGLKNGGLEDGGLEDGGLEDGGLEDGGLEDGGLEDGGLEDGGLEDGGLADGGLEDGGLADGGLADGGLADGGLQRGAGRRSDREGQHCAAELLADVRSALNFGHAANHRTRTERWGAIPDRISESDEDVGTSDDSGTDSVPVQHAAPLRR